MRRASRTDSNASELDQALTSMGWGIKKMDRVGEGFPDRVLCKHGRIVFAEYKNPERYGKKRKPNQSQQDIHGWFKRFGVEVLVFETVSDLAILDREARTQYGDGKP
jgi:hypothetical protein